MLKKLTLFFLFCLPLAAEESLGQTISSFSFSFYSQINNTETNIVFSPYSIFTALAMPYMGAKGDTAQAIESTFQFSMTPEQLAKVVSASMSHYTTPSNSEKGYQLNIANTFWVSKDFHILESFCRLLRDSFQAPISSIDFSFPQTASTQINEWISLHTQGKISNLLNPDDISKETRLVLTNALYFKGSWRKPFDVTKTVTAPFWINAYTSTEVPMMEQTAYFLYYESEMFQAIALPFIGKDNQSPEIAYVMILPKAPYELLEESLSLDWLDSLTNVNVHLKCPKFVLNERSNLQPTLSALGMEIAFTPDADFSGIDGLPNLYINNALHQAFFSVDEAGLTAAAATAVSANVTSIYTPLPPTANFIADHPFIFFLLDTNSKTPLFMGKLNAPNVNGS